MIIKKYETAPNFETPFLGSLTFKTLEYVFFLTRCPIYDTNPTFESPKYPDILLSGAYGSSLNIKYIDSTTMSIDMGSLFGSTTLKFNQKENSFFCVNFECETAFVWQASSNIKDFAESFMSKALEKECNMNDKRLVVEVTGRGIVLKNKYRTYQIKPDNDRVYISTLLPNGNIQHSGWFKTIKRV